MLSTIYLFSAADWWRKVIPASRVTSISWTSAGREGAVCSPGAGSDPSSRADGVRSASAISSLWFS